MKISNPLKKYKEIIFFTFTGVVFGFFILSPFAMVVSDIIHNNLPAEKIHSMYSNPWESIFEVFKPYLFIWGSIFAVFSGITGVFMGLYFKARREYFDMLNDSYKKLCELERLKDSLVYMIVHDLNNPLTGIIGNLQLLQMEMGEALGDEQKKSLEMALLSGEDMKRMIDNLLDINKMEEGKINLRCEDFKLDEATREVIERMQITARREDKSIFLEAREQLPNIYADKELIRRVIGNLISNAMKHIPQKGVIRVKVALKNDENIFYVQVEDNGEGIPKDYLEKVFDKFVQVEDKKAKMGRGLGLTFCKLAVEAHGGKIWVESEAGKGSTFYFTIPAEK
ncbi:MAG: HAMP domain-containing histidine kinase [Candidatus Omnitrophica bacterium]|nr:HAMP domain-containing histidine kinase [Candidatus Omnitrophota bacterium]